MKDPAHISLDDFLEPPQNLATHQVVDAFHNGNLIIHGLMPWSSNYTFLGTAAHRTLKFNFVYKPCRGERPLWDFEQGSLCKREVAAYAMSCALGNWPAIPPTILGEGPYGAGALQQFIHADYNAHYFTLKNNPQYRLIFQQIAIFDYLVNNADRKSGHCLLDRNHQIWAIDHGLTFHATYKLRTVIWAFAGLPIPASLQRAIQQFKDSFTPASEVYCNLRQLLSQAEIDGLCQRLNSLLNTGRFPRPTGGRDYPYPSI